LNSEVFPHIMGRGGGITKLRPGDVVEVRSAQEILRTLDTDASTEAMPFMPEMLQFVGKRFTVSRRVEKTCDTAGNTATSRRMERTVYLDDLRCDGSAHGGCQAGCRIYWKEEWLRPVGEGSSVGESDASGELEARARAASSCVREVRGEPMEVHRCQATEAPAASTPLGWLAPGQYIREVTSGNVAASHVASVLIRAAATRSYQVTRMLVSRVLRVLHVLGPRPEPKPVHGTGPCREIRVGDTVRVRSLSEIQATLDGQNRHRGLLFDTNEEGYFCGGTFTVQDRVERFVDDQTGEMIELSSDCLILEGVACSGERSPGRRFCPRAIYSFWREDWLERVDDDTPPRPPAAHA
jgi:hypothetical protein